MSKKSQRIFLVISLMTGWLSLDAVDPAAQLETESELIARGKELFFIEKFNGNGRTCGTCHPAENNFTLDPTFIATRPATDPLFVAEFNPALKENFEKPDLMRKFGLILENVDGFDDLNSKFVLRGIPHTLGLRNTVTSPQGSRTGWSGDGAPGDGSLRSFATGAVIQHFTRTLNRVPGVDFRLPTDEELDALEAFQLSLGRQVELSLPLNLRGLVAKRGQEIFLDNSLGKCNLCHLNGGANSAFGGGVNNANFNTGVENLPDIPAKLTRRPIPPDDGLGVPGEGTFNTPSLIEAADTPPFFHNNSVETIEGAVAFYNGEAFNNSPAGQTLKNLDPKGIGIKLDATQVVAVAAFLRTINALENIRQSQLLLEDSTRFGFFKRKAARELISQALEEIKDSVNVLAGAGLQPEAGATLREAQRQAEKARVSFFSRGSLTRKAIGALKKARAQLVEFT
jgi:hypothetical protein